MRLHVETTVRRSNAIVRLKGDIIYKTAADLFHEEIARLQKQIVVIDLEHVRTIDAYGLGRLAGILKVRQSQCTMVVNPQPRVLHLLRLTKLDFCLAPSIWCAPGLQDYRRLSWAS